MYLFIHGEKSNNNTTNNVNQQYAGRSTRFYVQLYFCCFIYLFSTITNFALVFGLRQTNKRLTPSQKLYIYLSITDTLNGMFMPYFVTLEAASIDNCTTTLKVLIFARINFRARRKNIFSAY